MVNTRTVWGAATRQAMSLACALAGLATVAPAQTTFRLSVSAVGTAEDGTVYRGTSQVSSTPAGIDCRAETVGGIASSGACNANFTAGTAVILTAIPLYDGTFAGWTGACAGQGTTCTVVMTADRATATQTIAKTFALTVVGTGNASGRIIPFEFFGHPAIQCGIEAGQTSGVCVAEYPSGKTAWLGREQDIRSIARFTGWAGCPDPGASTCQMVMDGPKTVTVGWVAMQVDIVSDGGNGTGTVTGETFMNTAPFACAIAATGATGKCSEKWELEPSPPPITLTATPSGSSVFAGWSGACTGTGTCVIPFNRNVLEVRALFTAPTGPLAVLASGTGSGRVIFDPSRPDCVVSGGVSGATCATRFALGTAVTLTADPTGGSTFGGWSGACTGMGRACSLTLNGATQATVRFVAPRPASELALALLGRLTISADERRELDRFGNRDDIFDLGDLLALLARTGERLSPSTMSALVASPSGVAPSAQRRIP